MKIVSKLLQAFLDVLSALHFQAVQFVPIGERHVIGLTQIKWKTRCGLLGGRFDELFKKETETTTKKKSYQLSVFSWSAYFTI